MTAYILRRLLLAIPVMLLVATATFLLLHMTPGDPVAVLLGPDATTEQIAELRRELGLNDPIYVQYGRWVAGALSADLGQSIFLNRPVTTAIFAAMVLGARFLWLVARLYRERSDQLAKRVFLYSMQYLGLLFTAMVIDAVVFGSLDPFDILIAVAEFNVS